MKTLIKFLSLTLLMTFCCFSCHPPCTKMDCGENARCIDGECICKEGFTGPSCEECNGRLCENGGTCYSGTCFCEEPYVGKFCEYHYKDVIGGTWINLWGVPLGFHEPVSQIMTIDQTGSLYSVKNFSNRGGAFVGRFNGNEFEVDQKTIIDPKCGDPVQIKGDKGKLQNDSTALDKHTYRLFMQSGSYQKNCNGSFIGSARYGDEKFYKVSDEVCETLWANDQCYTSIGNVLNGNWVLVQDLSIASTVNDHVMTIQVQANSNRVTLKNLFGGNKNIVADCATNKLTFTREDLPFYYIGTGSHIFRIDDDQLHGNIHTNGEFLVFQTIVKSSSSSASQKIVYRKNY